MEHERIGDAIRQYLYENQDEKYAVFQRKLIPTVEEETIVGVRTPVLRSYAKALSKRSDLQEFMEALPHERFEENQLHAFLISLEKDFDVCIRKTQVFLPYVDNWATCDQMSPKIFRKNRRRLLPYIDSWLASGHTYTIRYGIGMLMEHFLDEDFSVDYCEKVARVCSKEYYVNMMIAWYFATALAKQPQAVLPYFEEYRLERWTHNKAIQKACESYRISAEMKQYLRTLKVTPTSI